MWTDQPLPRAAPRVWPALVALGTVIVLSIGTLVVDMMVEHDAGQRIAEVVDNSLLSIHLVYDLRDQTHRLAEAQADPERLAAIIAQIENDARAYDLLAKFDGERDEWLRLQSLLSRAQHEQPPPTEVLAAIEASAQRLVAINQREAAEFPAEIRRIHRDGMWTDVGLGALTAAAAVVIGLVLVRFQRRERELLRLHLASLNERAFELEAFAARVSHDLKGPLSPISLSAGLLATNESPGVAQHAKRIERGAARMAAMIDDLLALSVSGHPPPGKAQVEPVIRELLDELEPELRGASVEVAAADCTAACRADVLAQVLRNVIANAAKYRSPERTLELRIAVTCDAASVEIAVGDNGVGMDETTRAHAFDPFFRAREAGAIAGHGLGLAIVKRTVDAVGGSCQIESERGQGTRVTVRLPAG
jgi:signal transduction histidine kinase